MWPFSKPQSYLGVDIGSNGIKLVELQKRGKHAHLFTYGYSEQNLLSGKDDGTYLEVDKTADLLKTICAKSKVKSKTALASLPASEIYSAVFSLPNLKKEEREAFVKREIEKLIPIPLADVTIDWRIISKGKIQAKGKEKAANPVEEQVFFTAAPKKMIATYTEIFRRAGLTLQNLESESLALISSLIGKDPSPILMIDIGAAQTDFVLVELGVPVLFHSLKIGGFAFTNVITKSMGVNEKEAEQIKRDLKSENGFPAIFDSAIQPIIESIHDTFELYTKQKEMQGAKPEKIILTGGSSLLPSLDSKLESIFNMKVYLGDPWARVIYPDELKIVLDVIGPRFAPALGLVLKKIEG